jgi:hypothetical protein
LAVPDGIESYYGWLATQHLSNLADASRKQLVTAREEKVNAVIANVAELYPVPLQTVNHPGRKGS